jgi:Transcription factor DP
MQREEYRATLERKKQQLQELNSLQRSYHALLSRNRSPTHRSIPVEQRIPLPFILVHTRDAAEIYVEMTPDYRDYFFDFNMAFELHEDSEVLNQLRL